MSIEQQVESLREKIAKLRDELGRVIVGHKDVVEQVIVVLLAGGHALLEGAPGLGKTLLVRTLGDAMGLGFSRIQFTPDLMPADIVGTNIVSDTEGGRREFRFQQGPIFSNLVLADEINRATPKTQSALLEAMQEHSVTVAGTSHVLDEPFFVLATQNPIEMEGTYPLPEAQLDRFLFKIDVKPPSEDELVQVLARTTGQEEPTVSEVMTGADLLELRKLVRQVPAADHVCKYAARLVLATLPDASASAPIAGKYVRYGSSPRGAQALLLAGRILALLRGRFNVSFADIREAAYPALRHRLILNFEGQAAGVRPDDIIRTLLEEVPEMPGEKVGAAAGA